MKSYFYFFILLFFVPLVAGVGFSPDNLVYDQGVGEENCKIISLSDVGENVEVINVWAANPDVDWLVSKFDTDAGDHGLDLTYSLAPVGETGAKVEVCVSGSDPGEYHGAMVFQKEKEGDSVFRVAVWLLVNIQETETQDGTKKTEDDETPSKGSPRRITTISVQETEDEKQEGVLDYENLGTSGDGSEGDETNLGDSAITGKAVDGDSVFKIGILQIIPFIFIALLVGAKIYVKRKNKLLNFSSN